jgi:hypothetical protein
MENKTRVFRGRMRKLGGKRFVHVGHDVENGHWYIKLSNHHGKRTVVKLSEDAMCGVIDCFCYLAVDAQEGGV